MPKNHAHHMFNTSAPAAAAPGSESAAVPGGVPGGASGGASDQAANQASNQAFNQASNQGRAVGFNSYTPSHLASATQRAVHRTPAAHAAAAHAQSGQGARGGAFAKAEASSSSFNQTSSSNPKNTHRHGGPVAFIKRHMSTILMCIGVALMLAAAGYWGYSQWCYYEQAQTNSKLAAFATVPDQTNDQVNDDVREDTSTAPQVDWQGLKAINSEVVGWLQVPNTPINYPVYQGKDNEHYLRHNAEGKWTIGGQIFMDCDNTAPGLVDQQSVLYGHHLKDGSMFYHFFLLREPQNFEAMTCVWYVTEHAAYRLRPLFYYYTNPDDQNVRKFTFGSNDEFRAYLQERLKLAVTKMDDAEKIIPHITKVITMSTCNYEPGFGRSETVCALQREIDLAEQEINSEK